jgi:beta-RFAP synthase
VQPLPEPQHDGPAADRALAFARRYAATVPGAIDRPHHVIVEACPPAHHGLGTGTQIGLAVAAALGRALGRPDESAVDLARRVGRGARSGVGVHGFDRGGFLVDGGKRDEAAVAPLVARIDFPADWRIVLIAPSVPADWHGPAERAALAAVRDAADDALCRLVLLGLLPALADGDLATFGDALFEYNVRAGEPFRAAQGGAYSSPAVADVVAAVRRFGVRGVGQSSWGPTVFAVVGDAGVAAALARALQVQFPTGAVRVTAARNGWCGSG